MSLVTPDDVRAQVDTDLVDSDLQMVIDRAEAEMIRQLGPHYVNENTTVTLTLLDAGVGDTLYLPRPAQSITSVTEYGSLASSATGTLLVSGTTYYVDGAPGTLYRIGADWPKRVVVEFVPVDDTLERERLLIELVDQGLRTGGMKSESIKFADGSSYSYQGEGTAAAEKARLYREMRGLRL